MIIERIYIFTKSIEIKGKIARKSKFWSQLGVKLNNFTTKDPFAKDTEL
jgi:hypothetical protein